VAEMDGDKNNTMLAMQNISSASEETAASTEKVTASSDLQLVSVLLFLSANQHHFWNFYCAFM
jgi:hypothetical protein